MTKTKLSFIACCIISTLATLSIRGEEAVTVAGYTFKGEELNNRFLKTFQNWAKADLEQGNVPAGDQVVCVGSSSMRMWKTIHEDLAPLKILHRGFGGSTMRDMLVFEDFFARYQAGSFIIYEGDNDLMGKTTPEAYVDQCKQFVAAMRRANPEAVFYFLPAKPSPSRWSKWPKFSASNDLLKAYCDATEGLTYIDIATPMLGEDGKPKPDIFLKDNLHMNARGYEIWTEAVRSALNL